MSATFSIKNYLPGLSLFIACVMLSLFIYKDYGISWDEPIQRQMGQVSYNYITKNDPALDTYIERDHGTGFEIVLIWLEEQFELKDTRDIFLMRRIASHLLFLISCFAGYILAFRLFRDQLGACLGFLFLAFNPRIFAHSWMNTKDLPFLAMFIISLAIAQLAFDRDKKYLFLLLGLAAGYTTAIRILGVILLLVIAFFLIIDLFIAIKQRKLFHAFAKLILFAAGFYFALYYSFPTLWADPWKNFFEVFDSLAHFRWEGAVLFQGKIILAPELPWTYLPVWILISNPVFVLLAGLTGTILLIIRFFKAPLKYFVNSKERFLLICFSCFLFPLLATILMHSVVYDDWRHLYFIYPAFVILALYAINAIPKGKMRKLALGLAGIQLILIGIFMVRSHPFQQVYFNELVSKEPEYLRHNYEMEYWGCSFKQGVEFILANDSRPVIKVGTVHETLTINLIQFLPEKDRSRIQVGWEWDSDYFMTNFRGHPEDYPYKDIVYEIKTQNNTILRVHKMR